MKTGLRSRFTRVDAAALLAFFAMWIYYILMVRNGYCFPDESFYATLADRFVRGDRPLVDEWARSQLAFLFVCLPYKLYVTLRGGTAGVILFMRCLFVGFNAVFYWCMYLRLRAYRWPALLATALFSMYVPYGFFACNYYTVAVRLLMLVCLALFSERQNLQTLPIAGVLFACAVLSQPGLAVFYFVYSALVWIRFFRRKKNKPFSDGAARYVCVHTWLRLTAGICLCAAVFLVWLLSVSGLRDILAAVPNMILADPEYDASVQGNQLVYFLKKIGAAIHVFSPLCCISALAVIGLSIAFACGKFRTRQSVARKILLCLACAVWIWTCRPTFRIFTYSPRNVFSFVYPVPLCFLGFICFLLCERKNKRFLFFWIVGFSASLCVDLLSNATLAICSPIAYIAVFVWIEDLMRELRAEKSPVKKATSAAQLHERNKMIKINAFTRWSMRLTCVFFAAWFAITFVWEQPSFFEHLRADATLFKMPIRCETGPFRALRYSDAYAKEYDDQLADIDTLKRRRPKSLYVCGLAPELYLHAEMPYACLTTFAFRETKYLDRQIVYWNMHPEKLPECVYFPIDDHFNPIHNVPEFLDWVHDSFDPLCEYTLEEGQGGYILYVSNWNPDALTGK